MEKERLHLATEKGGPRMRQSVTASTPPKAPAPVSSARLYELDWLRTLVVLCLIPVHAAVIFTPTADLYLKNAQRSEAMTLIGQFGGAFGMPVLFFVSGAAAWFALSSRTPGRWARDRVMRLLVPLIFASLVICPVQAYIVALSNPGLALAIGAPISDPHYLNSYPQFYVQYLLAFGYFLGHFSFSGFLTFVGHMWFVLYLFLFSLMALPLFTYLQGVKGRSLVHELNRVASYPGAIFALAAPLALVDGFAHALWSGAAVIAEIVLYFACFIYGYALFADGRAVQAMRQQWATGLVAGSALWLIGEFWLTQKPPIPYDSSMGAISFIPLRGIIAWCFVVGLVGLFGRYAHRTNAALRYLSDAAYPIYVLHVSVILTVGYFVVRWQAPIIVKYLFIILATVVILLILYEALIARIGFVRTLLGLRRLPAATARIGPPASGGYWAREDAVQKTRGSVVSRGSSQGQT